MLYHEVNFDGLIGPTHNYAGLSYGNLASQAHRQSASHPREAALQGLKKMRFLAGLGLKQAVLPPQERPDLRALRRLGFGGTDVQAVQRAAREAPVLLASCYSASAMWAANAGTVSPSADCADGRVHFTAANLASQFHRSLEAPTTGSILRTIFADETRFAHHDPLPTVPQLGDEGAANHTRLCTSHGQRGLELFVYGRGGFEIGDQRPRKYPARQAREASEAIIRLHQLHPAGALLLRQNPVAIDGGAFHNDVVAVGNENVLFHHAGAFADGAKAAADVRDAFSKSCNGECILIEVSEAQMPIADAVQSYLFNSQLVTLPTGRMALICPTECQQVESTRRYLQELPTRDTPIREVYFVDVRQSMSNGGGPACLRLRVVLSESEIAAAHCGVFLTDALYVALTGWVGRHYREELKPQDLADPQLIDESRTALDELTGILKLGSIYPFQI